MMRSEDGDIGRVDAEVGGAVAVDGDVQLGLVETQRRIDVDETWNLVHGRLRAAARCSC